jgi:hypothetical protein
VADLAQGQGITGQARRDWPRLTASAGRFVVSALLNKRGLPVPLSTESFLIPETGPTPNPRRPVLHLQRYDLPEEPGVASRSLLVAETILPVRGSLTILEARQAVMATLREHLPFIDEHLMVVDSPHDGLPAFVYSEQGIKELDRIHIRESSPGPEPMEWLWSVDPPGFMGVAGEPVRGPIPGSYLIGPTVLPALGQEGELLAAWSAARLVTRQDKTRQKMRRKMWNKIETN